MASFVRDYEGSVSALNSLQSNAQVLEKQKKDKSRAFTRGVIEVQGYAKRIGLTDSVLNSLNAVHVAGSKGKGSTCAMTECLLRHAGYKTGLYTSPHLIEARERIRINGAPISREMFSHYFWKCWDLLEKTPNEDPIAPDMPTYFRFLTILAMKVFSEESVDAAIIEVGIGGLYDATNILPKPVVCGITQLGLEHTALLGDTISLIARQKAGIMKPGVPVISTIQEQEAMDVLDICAAEVGAPLGIAPEFSSYNGLAHIKLGVEGSHQLFNAALALQLQSVWEAVRGNPSHMDLPLFENGDKVMSSFKLSSTQVQGLEACRWPGRSQVFWLDGVQWFMDGAHTTSSCKACSDWFESACRDQPHVNPEKKILRVLVFNCTGDRSPDELLQFYTRLNFDKALFCTGLSHSVGKADQENRNVDKNSKLARIEECKRSWDSGTSDGDKSKRAHSPSELVPYIEDCLNLIGSYENRDVQVLVTGSLHLVGSFLFALGRPIE